MYISMLNADKRMQHRLCKVCLWMKYIQMYEPMYLWTCSFMNTVFLMGSRGDLKSPGPHMYMMYICICNIILIYKAKDRNQYKFGNGYLTAEGAYEYGNVNVRIQKLYSWAQLRDTQY